MTSAHTTMTFGNIPDDTDLPGTVSSQFFKSFLTYASSHGAPYTDLLQTLGLTRDELEDDEKRLPFARYAAAMRAAKEMTGQPGLPLYFAQHADFSEVSIAGLIANASETMLDALIQLNRYGRLATDTPFEGETPLAFERTTDADWIVDKRGVTRFFPELTETTFTYLITGPRRFLPRPHVIEAHVIYEPPDHRSVYEEVWQCPIVFGAPRNALKLPTWVADHTVRLEPAYAFGIFTAHADRMLEDLQAGDSFADKLEALIIPSLHTGDVSIEWAASQLSMSRQTIYRHLKAEGTTFEERLDSLRYKLALQYLKAGKVTVAETAYLLGYADASPFTRAFKRWTGSSPRAHQPK